MSKIIYLKDILLAKAQKKRPSGRPKLKPFNQDAASSTKHVLKSSLVERNSKDGQRHGGRGEF